MPTQIPDMNHRGVLATTVDDHILVKSRCPAVQALDRIIGEIAPTEIPVLIVGESGTGKEVIARRIHQLSARRRDPFTKVICADLSAETFAALCAPQDDNGSRSTNRIGTVFFEEVSELDLHFQNKLLHLLPDGDLSPTGSELEARSVATTSHNLDAEIAGGRFREDLYYRLNGVCLRLPPLSQRKEDIPALVSLFASKYAPLLGRPIPPINNENMKMLMEYAWPGNIRQLENTVRRIVALGDEELALSDLSATSKRHPANHQLDRGFSLKEAARAASRQAERGLILQTLERTRWNRKRAARELQISYKALLYKLKQLDLDSSVATETSGGESE